MGNNFTIDTEDMIEYYGAFNAITYKYKDFFDKCDDNSPLYYDIYFNAYNHEHSKDFSFLTKKDFGIDFLNLKEIYGDEQIATNVTLLYRIIRDHVIGLYLNIDGMERLFSDKYINYEWKMHMDMDYEAHSMKFYRDHFMHQIKDAYTMDRLLNKFGYLEQARGILFEASNSKISSFVCKYVEQQMEKCDDFTDNLIEMLKNDNKVRESFLEDNENTSGAHRAIDEEKVHKFKRDYFLNNIIKMSCYMSAIFHDIGYPVVHNMNENEAIINYIFDTYNLNDYVLDFNKIRTLLQNSLLFRVVSYKQIKDRMEVKSDHGVISAIVFLLHFYENGEITKLEPYKACAVELAALAIYNHTIKYQFVEQDIGKKGGEYDYYRNVFFLNPISHLLRVSDDLQEWGRMYFEITDKPNLIICKKCHTPLIIKKSPKEEDILSGEDIRSFSCNCGCYANERKKERKEYGMVRAFSDVGLPYRRMYKVTICENMTIKRIDENREDSDIRIDLDYDLFRLLHMAYLSPTYAKIRIKELTKTRKLLVMQDTKEKMYLSYFVTANVIAIKSEIFGKAVMEYLEKDINEKQLLQEIESTKGKLYDNGIDQSCLCSLSKIAAERYIGHLGIWSVLTEDIKKCQSCSGNDGAYAEDYYNNLREYLTTACGFYFKLYLLAETYRKLNKIRYSDKTTYDAARKCIEAEVEKIKGDRFVEKNEDIQYMIDEYIRQAKNTYDDCIHQYPYYPKEYLKKYKEEELYARIKSFCDTDKYKPLMDNRRDENELDAYTDLELFQYIYRDFKKQKAEEAKKRNSTCVKFFL